MSLPQETDDLLRSHGSTRDARRASAPAFLPIAAIGTGLIATVFWWGFLVWKAVSAATLL